MLHHIQFEGLDVIVEGIRNHAADIAYLFLQDRTVAGCDEPVGRFDFEDLESAGLEDEATARAEMTEAAEDWLRLTTSRLTEGHGMRRFRVRCMASKGSAMVHSGQFVVRDTTPAAPPDPDPEPVRLPMADFSEVEHTGLTSSLHALGELYTRFGNLVLGSVGNLQRIHDSTTLQLHQQLQESRAQTDLLVSSILEARASEITVAAERQVATEHSDARSALARDAIQQVGEAARVLLSQQGLSPDAIELLQILQSSPALSEVLKDPAVRALIKQPGQLDQLAMVLRANLPATPQSNPTEEVPNGPPVR